MTQPPLFHCDYCGQSTPTFHRCTKDTTLLRVRPQGADGVMEVTVHDRVIGQVQRGQNGEWYPVPLGRVAHAHPLDHLDNIAGTGYTLRGAVETFAAAGERVAIGREVEEAAR